jgi:hypothetical protein
MAKALLAIVVGWCFQVMQRLMRFEHVKISRSRSHVQQVVASVGQVAIWLQDCCKQYNSIAELEEHLSSYDHHHKKRLADLKKMDQERTRGERNKKESKRQAKEAARLEKQCVFHFMHLHVASHACNASRSISVLGWPRVSSNASEWSTLRAELLLLAA